MAFSSALVARPKFPLEPGVPVPAIVVMMPVAFTMRITELSVSAM